MSSQAPPTETSPHPSAGDAPRRLVRTPDKKIAGVCAGIAHYLGLDPTVVRIVFLVSIFAGGIGLVAYGAGWLVMPHGEIVDARSVEAADGWTLVAVAAIALGVAALFGWTGISVGGQAFLGALLVAGGVVLLLRRPTATSDSASSPPDDRVPDPAGREPSSQVVTRSTATVVVPPADDGDASVSDPGRRGIVTAGTSSIAAIVIGGLVVARLIGWADPSVATVLAVALVVVGVGLVLGALAGPAPWLFVLAALLTCSLLAAATVEPWVADGIGEKTYAPRTAAALETRYELGIGDLEVDLGAVRLGRGEERRVEVALGVGSAVVVVPRNVDLELRAHVDAGQLVAPAGRSADGFDERLDTSYEAGTGRRLVVVLDVGFGRGEVRRGS